MTFSFRDDYSEGVHPEILRYISEHNDGQEPGYGTDQYCALATERICKAFGVEADVHFVTGGTQANLISVASMLLAYEGVISPNTGHINFNEAGAVEATGHKVVVVDSPDGILRPDMIDRALAEEIGEHSVKRRAVYLTVPTEGGVNYGKDDLYSVAAHAKSKGLYVYVDGARLAMALGYPESEIQMKDFGESGIDMFYLGGTKNGAMYGEAIVIVNEKLKANFRYHLKQHGALLDKQRYLGLQFARFFDEDNLWLSLGRKAVENGLQLARGLQDVGIEFARKPESNMIFPIMSFELIEKLRKDFSFHSWAPVDEKSEVVRLGCSWATPSEQIEAFVKATSI